MDADDVQHYLFYTATKTLQNNLPQGYHLTLESSRPWCLDLSSEIGLPPVGFLVIFCHSSKFQLKHAGYKGGDELGLFSKSVWHLRHCWVYCLLPARNTPASGRTNPNPMMQAGSTKKSNKRVLCIYKRGSDVLRCDTYLKSQLLEELVIQRPS